VIHARGDATGKEIQRAMSLALKTCPGITVFEHTFAIDLLTDANGRVGGLSAWTARSEPVVFLANEVILATGGAGQVYRETTNPAIATGDGVALGFRAGARVRDLEFFQFHPTCLYIAGAARVLISEIVRGAGGVLRDREGERFMPAFHADAELAPRDVVSRAVFERMVATGDTNVYLDLSGVERDPHELFPGISRICSFFGIDIARDPVPVRPGAHYMIGGLTVDSDGRTTLPGLWAVGECASSGLHGANRMGSNSLLEALVLGKRAGRRAADTTTSELRREPRLVHGGTRSSRRAPPAGVQVNIQDITYSLKSLMWRAMGVKRTGEEIEVAEGRIDLWASAVRDLAPDEPRTWELENMLALAQLACIAARAREESRGVHYRNDFPESDEAWCAHSELASVIEDGRITAVELTRVPVRSAAPRAEALSARSS
jgi:L-aspartate oxidase